MYYLALPEKIKSLLVNQDKKIKSTLDSAGKEIVYYTRKIKTENAIPKYESGIKYILNEALKEIAETIYENSLISREISLEKEVNELSKTIFPEIAPEEWKKYLEDTAKLINERSYEFLRRKSPFDGIDLNTRFKTIVEDSAENIVTITRIGIRDGKSMWDIAKEIENYIHKDQKTKWVSPGTLARRELITPDTKGFIRISEPNSLERRGGSVDYNAMRIARTEVMNNFRFVRIESTKNKDWTIGWRWSLSNAHPQTDICDEWASHNEGFGEGVYTDAAQVLALGHPHCLCPVTTETIFSARMRPYFQEAYKKLGVPLDKYSEMIKSKNIAIEMVKNMNIKEATEKGFFIVGGKILHRL